jgi:dTDP-4-amino-4,6-dideoxygalactose transaminase
VYVAIQNIHKMVNTRAFDSLRAVLAIYWDKSDSGADRGVDGMAWLRMIENRGGYIADQEAEGIEREAATLVGAATGVLVERTTDGLSMALGVCGIGDGDSVLCTPLGGTAALHAIRRLGARPVFVDINPNTFHLDPYCLDYVIRRHMREKASIPRVLVATDLFGMPCNYGALEEMCAAYDISLIEDMACGFGGAIGERKAGSFGRFAVASFFDADPAAEWGSDGIVFCRDEKDADVLRVMRNDSTIRRILHGEWESEPGDGQVQGVLLSERLEAVGEEAARRGVIAGWYRERLRGHAMLQEPGKGVTSAYTKMAVALRSEESRDEVMNALLAEQVPSSIYCPLPLHRRSGGEEWERVILVNAEQICRRLMLLPMNAYLSEKGVEYICGHLLGAL